MNTFRPVIGNLLRIFFFFIFIASSIFLADGVGLTTDVINKIITGTEKYSSQDRMTVNNVTIKPGANVTFESESEVVLGPEFIAEAGSEVTIKPVGYVDKGVSGRIMFCGKGLSGIAVTINGKASNGQVIIKTGFTDASGRYYFDVPAGNYTITCNSTEYTFSNGTQYFSISGNGSYNAANITAAQAPSGRSTAGTIPASFDVGQMGQSAYTIPIRIPPGFNGIQPGLKLSYSNFEGNGLLGVGWKLEGLPSITRIPASMAKDGYIQGVSFNSNDRFALNGEPLVLMGEGGNTAYGADGATYRTLGDDFTKIQSIGSSGNGPASFYALTKSGLIMRFGYTNNSRFFAPNRNDGAVLTWGLTEVYDRRGNSMTITYENTGSEFRPFQMDYRDINHNQDSPAYTCSVYFNYESRPDAITNYISGSPIKVSGRLSEIVPFYNGAQVRRYVLTYDNSLTITHRSLLRYVTEYGSKGNRFPSTEFSYSNLESGFQPRQIFTIPTSSSSSCLPSGATGNSISIDFDGDGRKDIFTYLPCKDSLDEEGHATGHYKISLALSTGTGFKVAIQEQDLPSYGNEENQSFSFGDYNGDGRMEMSLAVVNKRVKKCTFYVYILNESNNQFDPNQFTPLQNLSVEFHSSRVHIGDFNGDGEPLGDAD